MAEIEGFVRAIGRPLPADYLSLLAWSNGGEFSKGRRCLQVFPALDPVHGVLAMSEAYGIPRFMPKALPFAFNGGGVFYLFDLRGPVVDGEAPVVCSHVGNLGWDDDESTLVAPSFLAACLGTTNVDDLLSPGLA